MRGKKASLCYIQCSSWKHTSLFWACNLYPKMRKLLHFFAERCHGHQHLWYSFQQIWFFTRTRKQQLRCLLIALNEILAKLLRYVILLSLKELKFDHSCYVMWRASSKFSPPPHFFDGYSFHTQLPHCIVQRCFYL